MTVDDRKTADIDMGDILGSPKQAEEFSIPDETLLEINGVRYKVLKQLGRGGNGGVVLAQNLSAPQIREQWEKEVVIKYAFEGEIPRQALQREVEVMKLLQNPGLVRLVDSGPVEAIINSKRKSIDILVEERLFENPFVYAEEKAIPPSIAIDLFVNTLITLEHLHKKPKYIHGDIKPANILLRANRTLKRQTCRITNDALCSDRSYLTMALYGHWFPVIGDIGSAIPTFEKNPEKFIGTPWYASRESLLEFKNSPKRDVYALTISFFEMLTGMGPYTWCDDESELIDAMRQGAPPFKVRDEIDRILISEKFRNPAAQDTFKQALAFIVTKGIHQDADKRAPTYELIDDCKRFFDVQKNTVIDQDGRHVERLTQGIFQPVADPSTHYWYRMLMRAVTKKYELRNGNGC